MKTNYLNLAFLVLIIGLSGCKGHDKPKVSDSPTKTGLKTGSVISGTLKDKQEIQKLVRNMMVWAEHRKTVPDLLPYMINPKDSLVTGFDLGRLKGIDDSLKTTEFFSREFIDNYNGIIQSLDNRMKDKQIEPFSSGEIPPFAFDSDSDPWCDCQDVPYDSPDPYGLVDVHIIRLRDKEGEMYWTWGSLPKGTSADWKTDRYNFDVQKEDGKWKVSYLQGFDIKRGRG